MEDTLKVVLLTLSALVISLTIGLGLSFIFDKPTPNFKTSECIVSSKIPPWDKENTSMVAKVLQTSSDHVQLTQAPYYLGEYTMEKKDLVNYEVVPCPAALELPVEDEGEECGH